MLEVGAELVPGLVAVGGGGVLLAVVAVYEHRRESRMRGARIPFSLTFPFGTEPERAMRALEALAGLPEVYEPVIEVTSSGEEITHRVYLPSEIAAAAGEQLRAAVPGLRMAQEEPPVVSSTLAVGVIVPPRVLLRTADSEGAGRSLLAALLPLDRSEVVAVRWALRSGRPSDDGDLTAEPSSSERHALRAWQTKLREPGMFAAGSVVVQAAGRARAGRLAARVAAALATRRVGRSALVVRRRIGTQPMPRASRRSGWLSTSELVGVIGWPLGADVVPGVALGAARQIPPRRVLARWGRPLLVAEQHGQPRPVALSTEAARRHVAILGASGGGKSTLLAAGIAAEIRAGHAGVLLDPKSDLVAAVLDQVQASDADRIAVLDPAADAAPGVDLFGGRGDPDLQADVLLGIFRALSGDSWGPRLSLYLRLALRSLAEVPDGGLIDLPRLFLDPVFRRQVVARLSDPLAVGQWAAFEAMSEAEQAQHIQAPMSRIISLIGRPAVQAAFGPHPKLDVGELLENRGWLLVPLSSGVIGEPAARIIGSALTYLVWSHISSRAAIPKERRRPLSLFFDELTALTDQGIGLEAMFEQARGLGASVTVATQAIARVPDSLRSSLLANVGTLVTFRAGADEAARLARELPGLSAQDLQSLQPFEVAARVAAGRGSGSVVVTGRTEPPAEPVGLADEIRRRSSERWGRSRQEIEQAVRERYGEPATSELGDDVGRTGRRS